MINRLLFRVLSLFAFIPFTTQIGFGQTKAEWRLLENQFTAPQRHEAVISISNESQAKIAAGWKLYFNTIFISVRPESLLPNTAIRHLQGDFFVLEGNTPEIKPGEQLGVGYKSRGAFLKNSYPPEGLILVHSDGKVEEISTYSTQALS
jgi:hexosaminidase